MKHAPRLIFLLIFALLAPASYIANPYAAAPPNQGLSRYHFESKHFRISAPPPGIPNLSFYSKMCEEALQRITPENSFFTSNKIRVRISPSIKDFEQVTKLSSRTTMAVAFPDQGYMALNLEALQAASPFERLQVIGHELVHLILGQIAAGEAHVPAWLHEGMAQILSGQHDLNRTIQLAWANIRRSRIPMTRLIYSFPYSTNQADLAYAQSASFTRHVAEKELHFDDSGHFFQSLLRDPEKAKTLLARLSDKDIVAEMESNWLGGEKGPRNYLLIITSGGIIWGIITLLFLAAYYYKKRSQQTVIQEWDPWERENEEPVNPDEDSDEDQDEESWRGDSYERDDPDRPYRD